jgi:hypothetical protein
MDVAFALTDPVVDMAGRVDSIWLSTVDPTDARFRNDIAQQPGRLV